MNNIAQILESIEKDTEGEGVVGNCRWRYHETSNHQASGQLNFAFKNTFDRWANSTLITLHTVMLTSDDLPLDTVIYRIVEVFQK
jgi:hypothetical protein